jgi:hypothetical protein
MAIEEPALTMKEAVSEIRKDVKTILEVLPLKSDKADNILLERRIETLETEAARRRDIEELRARIGILETGAAVTEGIANFKKVIVGLAVTTILTVLGLIGSVALRLLPPAHH